MGKQREEASEGSMASRRRDAAFPVAQSAAWGVILLGCVWLSVRVANTVQLGVIQDDAMYVVLAQSLVHGDAYGLVNGPGPARPYKYGFAFPLTLAPVVWAFPARPAATAFVPLAATLANLSLL